MKVRVHLRKSIWLVLVAFIAGACGMAGCASNKAASNPEYARHMAEYPRLALVCAPGSGADPAYAVPLLREAEKMVPTRLNFLKKVDCLNNVQVDALATPPRATLSNPSDYDAVVILVYSYNADTVDLNMTMVDTKSGQVIWTHKLSTKDKDAKGRLMKHGYWTPSTIKMDFYGQ